MSEHLRTKIAFVGCGYVADFYALTLKNHPQLELSGVFDRDSDRSKAFSQTFDVPVFPSLEELLGDPMISIVVNLTNPQSHFSVSKAALFAGKHVYTEKPISLDFLQSKELARIAEEKALYLSSAPCTVLSPAAQTTWKAVRNEMIGKVRLVYAEMDDGLLHQLNADQWRNTSGAPWPFQNELATGCTFEHAGYWISWLVAMFGPAVEVSSFAANLVENPIDGMSEPELAPDFSVACLRFSSGVVARLTCSIVASRERQMRIFGDKSELIVSEAWDFGSRLSIRGRPEMSPERVKALPLPLVRRPPEMPEGMNNNIDFCCGIAELANAISEGRPSRLSADFGVHIDELCQLICDKGMNGASSIPSTTFDAIEPMEWAK